MKRLTVAVLCALTLACGANPKVRGVQVLQATHASLSAAQDAENVLCGAAPAAPTHCAAATASHVGLTDARHQAFNAALAKAFDAEIKVGQTLQAWKPGDPLPAQLPELLTTANAALDVATTLTTDANTIALLKSLRAALDSVIQLTSLFGGR